MTDDDRKRDSLIVRWFAKAREFYRKFRSAPPGERFIRLHEDGHDSQSSSRSWRWLSIALGVVLILAGAALGLVPGLPGVVVSVVGLGIIAAQVKAVACWCDRSEMLLRRLLGKSS